ncbi:putative CUE domain-containing protein [Glarea lozoyensis 74030]|uniref:RNA polymerase II degradation factor 1 n=1 Tax=Glarea lozoyensis (strain ATCC 74030 / MF5533) TaxID=1104152 RepID=H0EQF9_GLAL7|nr:putative CUE domain-containing protein [Glarea lozoyensis 74030]
MSEVQSRPTATRGRGSARGGRGGFSSRGGRGGGRGHATNGDHATPAIEDEGEVGQLKRQYGSKVTTIKEMFPDWTDEDVVFALQETDGDLETTVGRITDGTIAQWGEVSKGKKDRSRSKAKDISATPFSDSTNQSRPSRGGRAGFDSGRGGRGRGTDRGRGGKARGASVAHTNGSRKENEPTSAAPDTTALDTEKTAEETSKPTESTTNATEEPSWASSVPEPVAAAASAASSVIPAGIKKSWASMFAAPAPTPKKAPENIERPAESVKQEKPAELPVEEPEAPAPSEPSPPIEPVSEPTPAPAVTEEAEASITPSHDELTEDNLEQVLDTSAPAPTATAASTTASSWDPRANATSTPISASQQTHAQPIRPPPSSGFQASALKATGSGRTASYQRRVLDQEEAVRMPGNREVDRAAVQFGAFNLNGSGDEDVDGDREEPETRGQPPQHSPVAPRASLPPATATPQPAAIPEPAPKQPSAGLPAAPPTGASQQAPPANAQYSQYGRFGQTGAPDQPAAQKSYDAFSQQAPSTQSPFEGYPNQTSQSQPQQNQSGAFSSAPNEYSQYYTADSQRNAYNGFYNQQQQYGQGQEGPGSQHRSYSGFNGPQSESSSQFPQSAAQASQSRYATAGEGQNISNPVPIQEHNPSKVTLNNLRVEITHTAILTTPNYGGGNYPGGPYGGKGGLHQQPYQGYGMSPGAPYEQHASSPAAGGFGGGGLGEYGRGSTQSSQTPQGLGASGAFGGAAHDAFSRGSPYQGQGQQHYSGNQGSQPSAGDDLKPFGDSKTANGPSPSLSQAGRPGSATNAAPGLKEDMEATQAITNRGCMVVKPEVSTLA